MLTEVISLEADMSSISDVSELLRRSGLYIDSGYILESFGCEEDGVLYVVLNAEKKSVIGFRVSDKTEEKDT